MDVGTGAIASLLRKLDELLNEKYKLQASSREDVVFLSREMKSIHAFLHKVAEVSRGQLDHQVEVWARKVRQMSYSMELAVDSCFLSETSSEVSKGLIKNMGNLFKKGKTCHEIVAKTIKGMKLQVKEMAELRERYKIDNICARPATMINIDPRLRALYTEVTDLVGIDGQKDQDLIKLLSDGDRKLKIVSVVGFGGLGKTTLVKAVYDKMKSCFDRTAFVSAGQNADVEKVIRDIIQDITLDLGMYGSQLNTLPQQRLIRKLGELLENRRYLIVIDDLWNRKAWDIIKLAFSRLNSLGSRIITTTRVVSVSEACCSSSNDSIYQMKPLSDVDSKKLLCNKIFSAECGCPQEYEQVCIDILKKCGGVPLAIITMAFMLCSHGNDFYWIKKVNECHVLLSSIGHGRIKDPSWEDMLRILSLGYKELSTHLKTCLLYSSIFPGALPIIRDRLVKKLVVEGIVTQETKLIGSPNKYEARLSEEISPEEAASHCLDELVDTNIIHPLECNSNGEVISYHIHPLMHLLLKEIGIHETFAASLHLEDNSGACLRGVPYLSIYCPDSENQIDLSSIALDGVVHSVTVFDHGNKILPKLFKWTRVLDLEGCKSLLKADVEYICSMVLLKQLCLAKTEINELPPEIGNLKYLEGLDVGGTQITQLPPQIGKLQHLTTLDARKSGVKDLPNEVVQLTRLVHLLVGDNESCEGVKLPDGFGKMISLQELGTIDLRKCSVSSLKELIELPNLKEIAVLLSDEPEETRTNHALLSSLNKSTELRSLVVYSDFRLSTLQSSSTYNLICRKKLTLARRSFNVPTGIAEQCFLGMLDIRLCKLEEGDLKILRELPRLQSLTVRLEVLPTKMIHIIHEGFAKLESFYVDCRIPRVTFEEGAMPKLQHLELKMYSGSASEEHMDIKNLLSLQKVTLRYAKWYASNKGVRETTEAVKTECKEHQNEITLCIAEEEKDGICNTKTKIFQENRVASYSKMTEIVKEEDTQDGGLHHSSCATASCRGTSEIEEVAE